MVQIRLLLILIFQWVLTVGVQVPLTQVLLEAHPYEHRSPRAVPLVPRLVHCVSDEVVELADQLLGLESEVHFCGSWRRPCGISEVHLRHWCASG